MISRNMTDRQKLNRLKELRNNSATCQELSDERKAEIDRNKREWLSFWRNNIHLYMKHKLKINSYGFQMISYYLMSQSVAYDELTSRGGSKTFKFAAWDLSTMLIFPNTEIVITSSTFAQSCLLIDDKIIKEFSQKPDISPVLYYLFKRGIFEINRQDQKVIVRCTLNNSTLTAVGCVESSRGLKANIIQYDERILLKDNILNSIFRPMRRPRQVGFLNRPEYQNENKSKYLEQPKVMSISSNRFKYDTAYTSFMNTLKNSIKNPKTGSYICAWDIFVAIKNGIKTKESFYEDKRSMDEVSFKSEILNCPIGEINGAFFTLQSFRENQCLDTPFCVPTKEQYMKDEWKFREKRPDEIRIVFADFAWVGGAKNDNTVIGCMSLYPYKVDWKIDVEYIKSFSGAKTDIIFTLKEIFHFYQGNYLVYDSRSGGDVLTNIMSAETEHPWLSDRVWHKNGYTPCLENDLQLSTNTVVDEIRQRTIDPNALPLTIPVKASPELNHNMWMNLNSMLKNNQINFLIDVLDYMQIVETQKSYILSSAERKAQLKLPFIETKLLIEEAINLKSEFNGTYIKLKEPQSKTKDRVVSLAYACLLAQKLINKKEREKQHSDLDDIENIQLVF